MKHFADSNQDPTKNLNTQKNKIHLFHVKVRFKHLKKSLYLCGDNFVYKLMVCISDIFYAKLLIMTYRYLSLYSI